MDKRTKILLIILVALVLAGGGAYVYMFMAAKKPAPPAPPVVAKAVPARPQQAPAVMPMPAPPAPPVGVPGKLTTPAPPVVGPGKATTPAPPAPPVAPAKLTPPMPPAPPAPKAPVAPAKLTPPAPPAPPAPKAPVAPAKLTTPAPQAAYVPVIKVTEKGKPFTYNSPEEFIAKTGMSPAEIRDYSNKSLDAAKKAYDSLKGKPDKAAQDRADKDLKMMERLSSQVASKFPEQGGKAGMIYASLGKRDPFMSPLQVPKVYPKVPPEAKPLERDATESLRVEAIMWSEKGYRAMVVTADGRGYMVKVGDSIGNKKGKVVDISAKRVHIVEKIIDILGDIETRNIVLKLHKEAE